MEKFSRSKSTREGVFQQPTAMKDLRSYSTSTYNNNNIGSNNNALSAGPQSLESYDNFNEVRIKKGNSKSRISSASSKNWSFNMDPELQRKKRVAGYKAYTVEGKMKGSFRKSFRWIKDVVHGLW